jgi:DnaJ-class molecular chaperone
LRVDVTIDVLTAVLGGKVQVPALDGSVQLTIPPGTQGGQTFRLKGKGMPYLRDEAKFGDLMTRIKIRIPKEINDDQRRLYQQLAELD